GLARWTDLAHHAVFDGVVWLPLYRPVARRRRIHVFTVLLDRLLPGCGVVAGRRAGHARRRRPRTALYAAAGNLAVGAGTVALRHGDHRAAVPADGAGGKSGVWRGLALLWAGGHDRDVLCLPA